MVRDIGGYNMPDQKFPLSVIVLTYNEESTIEDCLLLLDWAEDVILVDSFSTDRTIEVASSARLDLRVFQNRFEDFGSQRNYALDETSPRHDWVLFIDADEHCNAECQAGIRQAVMEPDGNVGFYLANRNMFLGRWIKHCTLYPSWQLRLLKRGEVRYSKEGHGQREVTDGPLGFIQQPYDHYGFSHGIAHWIDRHNRYSTHEIELIQRLRREPTSLGDLFVRDPIRRRRCLKRLGARFGFRPLTRFGYLYFIRGGFLDGWPGLHFCLLCAAQEIHITAKLFEAEHQRSSQTQTTSPSANATATDRGSTPATRSDKPESLSHS